jgi:hypothetical protein
MHNERRQAPGLQKPLKHLWCQPGRVLTLGATDVVAMSYGTWCHSFVAFSKPCWLLETVFGGVRCDSTGVWVLSGTDAGFVALWPAATSTGLVGVWVISCQRVLPDSLLSKAWLAGCVGR